LSNGSETKIWSDSKKSCFCSIQDIDVEENDRQSKNCRSERARANEITQEGNIKKSRVCGFWRTEKEEFIKNSENCCS